MKRKVRERGIEPMPAPCRTKMYTVHIDFDFGCSSLSQLFMYVRLGYNGNCSACVFVCVETGTVKCMHLSLSEEHKGGFSAVPSHPHLASVWRMDREIHGERLECEMKFSVSPSLFTSTPLLLLLLLLFLVLNSHS